MNASPVRDRTAALVAQQTSAGFEQGVTLGERNFDSLDIVELELAIEAEFNVRLPDNHWSHDTTVEQVLADVARIVGGDQ